MTMNLLKFNRYTPQLFNISQTAPPIAQPIFHVFTFTASKLPPRPLSVKPSCLSNVEAAAAAAAAAASRPFRKEEELEENENELEVDGAVYQNTLRLVECSMFAAVTGLVYFLSNSLSIENYFGCFFSLPIVISSLRWGVTAGRKTMVATAMLLFVLSGPVKALVYLLTHGLVGFTMGSLWRLGANWGMSIFLCTMARATGAMGYVLTSSFLIRENILALITINIHASLTFIFAAAGINIVPSMSIIYTIFGVLVVLNSGFFVFLLHLLYAVFLTRLGMKYSLRLPRWLEKAL